MPAENDQKLNTLCDRFATVGNRIASKLPSAKRHYLCNSESLKSSCYFQTITTDEVKSKILSMTSKNHTDYVPLPHSC